MASTANSSKVKIVGEEMSITNMDSGEIIRLSLTDVASLVASARKVKGNAYAPYSKFCVGSAILTPTGEVFTGCNVENAVLPTTMCAETVAIGKAVSEGFRKFNAIAVSTNNKEAVFPCGPCRQATREFGKYVIVICANVNDEYQAYSLEELLPHSFGPEDLDH